jgi:predicted MFS family arabinose efflux permease
MDATSKVTSAPRAIFVRVALPFIAGYFVSYVYRMVNAVLGPTLAREFGLSAGSLGLLSSIYFLSFALFQLPLGLLLDRFGPRRVDAALLLVAAVGGTWFAAADSFGSALAARALIGLGVSGCLMSAFTAFVLWYPPERLSTLNSLAFSAGTLGAITATVPLELMLRVWHWRQVFMAMVAATLAVSLVLWFWVPEHDLRRGGEKFVDQLRGLLEMMRDSAFRRLALCLGAHQFAAVSLQTLWIGTWLRDVAGYSPAQVARGLLAVNVAMIVGYMSFGRAADGWQRRGRSPLPLLALGVAISSASLGLILLGIHFFALVLWSIFVGAGTAVVLAYSILSRRYPKAMAGRANTALNVVGFIGMFSGQWGIGVVLDLWPQSAAGYAPEAYGWALGMVWAVQFLGLAWLWAGRRLWNAQG